jgi:hypothetical protein
MILALVKPFLDYVMEGRQITPLSRWKQICRLSRADDVLAGWYAKTILSCIACEILSLIGASIIGMSIACIVQVVSHDPR